MYLRVVKGMYGLPQSGANSHDELEERLENENYYQSKIIPGLWKHKTRPTIFALIVDDFGIKYMSLEDLNHLIDSLKKYYNVKVDLDGKEYLKIELDWEYNKGLVHLSMAPYLPGEGSQKIWYRETKETRQFTLPIRRAKIWRKDSICRP